MIATNYPDINQAKRVRVTVTSARDQSIWLNIPSGLLREFAVHAVLFPAGKRITLTTTLEEVSILHKTEGLVVIR